MNLTTLRGFLNKAFLNHINHTHLSSESYGVIDVIGDQLQIIHGNKGKHRSYKVRLNGESVGETVKREIAKIHIGRNYKLVATVFSEKQLHEKIAPGLWLEEDVVSFLLKSPKSNDSIRLEEKLKIVSSGFDQDNIARIKINAGNEVEVSDLVSLSDYEKIFSGKDFTKLFKLAAEFKGRKIVFINSTPQGGGVALMRHALIRFFELVDVGARWYTLRPDPFVFKITKGKFHNTLQGVTEGTDGLTKEDREKYNLWMRENAALFSDIFVSSDVIVIDDPQPSGLIPHIKEINPKAKIIYRSHIQIDTKLTDKNDTVAHKTWNFIWQNIKQADLFVSHPVASFVPKVVPREKVVYMPATTDPLDGLNKPLTEAQMEYYIGLFNKFLKNENQSPLDLRRPYIIQIARFDPSKGISDVLDSYLKLTAALEKEKISPPQLVVAGNGSIDDPDAIPVLRKVFSVINSKDYARIRKNIKIIKLPHIDQLFNTLLRKSKICLQLSTREGFEIKVTEALMKGKPVIAYKTGGIPLQIKDGINGFLVEPGDTRKVSEHIYDLLTKKDLYREMSQASENYYDKALLTMDNAIRWLELAVRLTKKNCDLSHKLFTT